MNFLRRVHPHRLKLCRRRTCRQFAYDPSGSSFRHHIVVAVLAFLLLAAAEPAHTACLRSEITYTALNGETGQTLQIPLTVLLVNSYTVPENEYRQVVSALRAAMAGWTNARYPQSGCDARGNCQTTRLAGAPQCTEPYPNSWPFFSVTPCNAPAHTTSCWQSPTPGCVELIHTAGGTFSSWYQHKTSAGSWRIRLSGPDASLSDGFLATVAPNHPARLSAVVSCEEGTPITNVPVRLELSVEPGSGGHPHDHRSRPPGLLSNGIYTNDVIEGRTGTGGFPFMFLAPPPSGNHKVTASCTDRRCVQDGADTIWVGIKGLIEIPRSSHYELIGYTPSHPAKSHFLTPNISAKAQIMSMVYRSQFLNDPVLHLNDASLERGGLFDSSAHLGLPWQPPHPTHRQGREIDVRWNPGKHPATSVPDSNVVELQGIVRNLGGRADRAYVTDPNNKHLHVQFSDAIFPEVAHSVDDLGIPPPDPNPDPGSDPQPEPQV